MAAAAASRAVYCELARQKPAAQRREATTTLRIQQAADATSSEGTNNAKIVLQPRLCTLRSYSSGSRDGLATAPPKDADLSPFFVSLADYIENSRKSQDFETISGRLAMVAFASAIGVEVVTGDSLFKKLDLKEMAEAAGVCLAVVACAAAFAWVSSARNQIGKMLTLGCNNFVDSLIDNLVDGLFFDSELSDWSDEV